MASHLVPLGALVTEAAGLEVSPLWPLQGFLRWDVSSGISAAALASHDVVPVA